MKVLVTGASGLVGSALVPFLTGRGHQVVRLVRAEPRGEDEVRWDAAAGEIDAARLEGLDAVVHLAGESIAGRWSAARKERILDSRVAGTRVLAETLAGLQRPPGVLVSSSAVGYYGDRGDETLTEDSSSGSLFLSEVCRQWEAATEPAARKGIRVVILRTAPVLAAAGGPLAQMLLPFRLGLGGPIGGGKQYFPWIAIDDIAGAYHHALTAESLSGPVNAVAPGQVTNREFTKTLGRVLGRPSVFPLPAFAARLALGEMARELLLASARVEPAKLVASGYKFAFPELESALRRLLGK
ncbi:MAG: TIGR01777 family oxidoreductase [Dehalococcoidia bacterium]